MDLTKKKLIILNAPPRAGKDRTLEELLQLNPAIQHIEFKAKLFEIALVVSCLTESEWFERYNATDTDGKFMKDKPWDRLGGLSQREFLIKISEEWVKPVFGDDYFGQAVAATIKNYPAEIFCSTDGGFDSEVPASVDELGAQNVFVVQWGRDGCSFDNDSRDYLTEACGAGNIIKLENNDRHIDDHIYCLTSTLDKYYGVKLV